jgi:DNA-binding NarL/FixJ family response regulator
MFRASLRHLLTAPPAVIKDVYGVHVGPGFEVVGEAGSGEETVAVVKAAKPDLLLLDLSMPRMSGLEALAELEAHCGSTRTILLWERSNGRACSLRSFWRGSSSRPPDRATVQTIAAVVGGRFWLGQAMVGDLTSWCGSGQSPGSGVKTRPSLTPRERDVLGLVVAGHTNREIATTFSVSEETVKHHLTRMFDKVGASNRLELAMKATRGGLTFGAAPTSDLR